MASAKTKTNVPATTIQRRKRLLFSLLIAQLHLDAPNRFSIAYEEIVATKDGREKHEDVQKKSKARGNFWRFLRQSIGRRSATGMRRCRGERIVWQKDGWQKSFC